MLQYTIQAWRLVARPKGMVVSAEFFILPGFGFVRDAGSRPAPGANNLALAHWRLAEQNGWQHPCLITHPLQSERAARLFGWL